MNKTIESTTDTPEQIKAAMGQKAPAIEEVEKEKPAAEETLAERKDASGASENESKDQLEESEEEDSEAEGEQPRPQKKKGGFKKRIDKLSKNLSVERQEKEFWRQKALEFEKSAALKSGANEKASVPSSLKEPDPNDFKTQVDYLKAQARYEAVNELDARDLKSKLEAQRIEEQKASASYQDRFKEFEKSHPDMSEVLSQVDDIKPKAMIQEVIRRSPDGPAIAYALAQDRDEFERINSMDDLLAIAAIGALGAKIKGDSFVKSDVKPKPKPITPIGAKGMQAPKSLDDAKSYSEFKKLRVDDLKSRGRRI